MATEEIGKVVDPQRYWCRMLHEEGCEAARRPGYCVWYEQGTSGAYCWYDVADGVMGRPKKGITKKRGVGSSFREKG